MWISSVNGECSGAPGNGASAYFVERSVTVVKRNGTHCAVNAQMLERSDIVGDDIRLCLGKGPVKI